MPTILRIGSYRFFFYSSDGSEPVHVHVESEDKVAKFWTEPVRLAHSGRFNRAELVRIQRLVLENESLILEKWNEFFA